ncbi:MAG: hypothetical protein QG588_1580 [Candidatus Poribacteria bacterium]|nr:hypothetical protein [Candidatus Poribacteria bacterium]
MTLYGIVCVAFLFIITSLLTIGGFVIQRDKYWMRIWNELGKPEIKSIKELKAYSNKYSCQNLPPLLDQSHLGLRSK